MRIPIQDCSYKGKTSRSTTKNWEMPTSGGLVQSSHESPLTSTLNELDSSLLAIPGPYAELLLGV